jgi:peptidoglycan hydrolase-like protein with peptidoglycan-binding domain
VIRRAPWLIFGGLVIVYVVLGTWLAAGEQVLFGDALSRVSAAQAALHSRDPHLAAIGFVFTPLTAIVQLPIVAFSGWFPGITRWGLSGVLMSAVFMAASAAQIWGIGTDRRSPTWQIALVTAFFALNPMTLYYGMNGMSEAPFLFFCCWAVRHGIRWVHSDDVHDLMWVGISLGLGFLVRYDAALVVFVSAIAVGVRTGLRGRAALTTPKSAAGRDRRGGGGFDWHRAAIDLTIVAAPGFLAFVVWTFTSWLLTGDALTQFSSQYGNAAIIAQEGAGQFAPSEALRFSSSETLILVPTIGALLILGVVIAWLRRDLEAVVAPIVFGTVLPFQFATLALGSTFGFLRYYIAVIPLACVLVLQLAPVLGEIYRRRPGRFAEPRVTRPPALPVVGALATAVLLLGIPFTAVGMLSPALSSQQYALAALFASPDNTSQRISDARRELDNFSTERAVADYLDRMDLPEGSVIMDTVYGFAVTVASKNPATFVIPSDQDFVTILDDPAANGVRYILAVPNSGRGAADAVNRRYPTLYDTGADVATLELEFPNNGLGQPTWRLYRVLS